MAVITKQIQVINDKIDDDHRKSNNVDEMLMKNVLNVVEDDALQPDTSAAL